MFSSEATEGPRDSKRIKQTHNEPSGYVDHLLYKRHLFTLYYVWHDWSYFVDRKPILIKDISNEWDAKLKPYAQTALLYYNERMVSHLPFYFIFSILFLIYIYMYIQDVS